MLVFFKPIVFQHCENILMICCLLTGSKKYDLLGHNFAGTWLIYWQYLNCMQHGLLIAQISACEFMTSYVCDWNQ